MNPLDEVRSSWASLASEINAADESILVELRSRFLGKKGEIPGLMRHLGAVPGPEKPAFGACVQALRQEVESVLDRRQEQLREDALKERLERERLDLSLGGDRGEPGTLHPLVALRDEILDLFVGMGFEIADAPEIDSEWFNFTALNVPDDHPARDMQDTFFLSREPGQDAVVLRTHTSNYQIHAMTDRKPPFRLLNCGQVYRCDADATHSPMFCQVEGLVLDTGISFSHLKATIYTLARALYGERVVLRFRPSFFPFTEPSAEMDVDCRSAGLDRDGWMEIGGPGERGRRSRKVPGIRLRFRPGPHGHAAPWHQGHRPLVLRGHALFEAVQGPGLNGGSVP
jgi:phenylalanyl-tRNA synthetase alpha chain